MRLRASPLERPFHVVLVEPEIPPNTGSIARLCAATGSHLHLVGRLGFRIDEQSVRRAGVDYWHLVSVRQHVDFSHLEQHLQREAGAPGYWMLTAHAERSVFDVPIQPGDALVFGKESVGLDPALLARYPDRCVGIPTLGAVRSINVANAASIVLYEALRRTGALAAPFLGE